MGDSCCAPHSLGALAADVEAELGVAVVSIDTGGGRGAALDVASGFVGSVDAHVAAACASLAGDARLTAGFNAVGFSQGGLFLRALAQRCPSLPLRTLVTLGAPHRGVAAPPACPPPTAATPPTRTLCGSVEAALAAAAYAPGVKDVIIQAQYFKDPARLPAYTAARTFVADVNNEGALVTLVGMRGQ
jgi:palmitoyl-protein thioesterase